MYTVAFVCLGNICRSPMAEFIFRDMVEKAYLSGQIRTFSRATSPEEAGNPVYPPARRELLRHGISPNGKYAEKLKREDYENADLFLCMDRSNYRNTVRFFGAEQKIFLLSHFSGVEEEVADPWYTGDFAGVYKQMEGYLKHLLSYVQNNCL